MIFLPQPLRLFVSLAILLVVTCLTSMMDVSALTLPNAKLSRYPTNLLASRDGKNGGGWFFRPAESKNKSVKEKVDGKKSDSSSPRVATLVKSKQAEMKKAGIIDQKTLKNGKAIVQAANRIPSSPLEEIQNSPSSSMFDASNPRTIFGLAAVVGLASIVGISYSLGLTIDDFIHGGQTLVTNPSAFSEELIAGVQSLGPTGVFYYAFIYMIAEILAIPATPLTLSAGYLFGVQNGILTVLVGATGAACVGFWISRTFLRDYVESTLLAPAADGSSPNTLAKLDKAIGKEGFKLLVLIRLSPIFPFSVTNYLYGASSIDFGSYLAGTLIGFVPTTTAYVYTGMIGQALTAGDGADQPWYVYAGGFVILGGLVKLVTDVATGIIETIEED